MNKNFLLGSSETTCKETAFNLLKNDRDFVTWFIGFTEGNSSFVIPKNSPPQFEITQHLKDVDLLYKIKRHIGFGSIIKRKKRGVYQIIGNYKFLTILAYIFNGNLRCPQRQIKFKAWLDKLKEHIELDIKYINNDVPVTTNDSWLSGFTDAEGYFGCRLRPCRISRYKHRLALPYELSKKTEDILWKVIKCFNLKSKVRYDESWKGYRFNTEDSKKRKDLIRYFNKYPLKTKKKIDYLRWRNLSKDFENKLHLSLEEIKVIKKKFLKIKKV